MKATLTRNDTGEGFELPTVTQVEDTDTASLTEMSTVIYGAENRFVIDLGTKRTITLTCVRVNPSDCNDSSSDPAEWSNARWWRRFVAFVDDWQVLMGEAGGFRLAMDTDDAELFPAYDVNVTLNGSVSPTFGVQSMRLSIPLVASTVQASEAYSTGTVTVTFHDPEGVNPDVQRVVSEDMSVLLPTSMGSYGWTEPWFGATLSGWSIDGRGYELGGSVQFEGDATVDAVWAYGTVMLCTKDGDYTVPSGMYTATFVVVGAGGGAGGAVSYRYEYDGAGTTWLNDNRVYAAGGGGGAGEVVSVTCGTSPGSLFHVTVGSGGRRGSNESTSHYRPASGSDSSPDTYSAGDGGDGGDTVLIYDNAEWTAAGGSGGSGGVARRPDEDGFPESASSDAWLVSEGGSGGGDDGETCKGGDTGPTLADTTGGTGPLGDGVPGTGAEADASIDDSTATAYRYAWGRTAGGGAATVSRIVTEDGAEYVSRGGDGGGKDGVSTDDSTGGDGALGGGGGSGTGDGGAGGDGFVVVAFYER